VAAKSEAGETDVESQAGEHLEKHYVPILELFRGYWSGLLLQCGYEACECKDVMQVLSCVAFMCVCALYCSWAGVCSEHDQTSTA
jgi:hypothetical protein